jgi:hypothetical protein
VERIGPDEGAIRIEHELLIDALQRSK